MDPEPHNITDHMGAKEKMSHLYIWNSDDASLYRKFRNIYLNNKSGLMIILRIACTINMDSNISSHEFQKILMTN